MPATEYKVWQRGASVGQGAMSAHYVGVHGIAKAASDAHPMAVVNEVICGDLGRILLLPIPPGFIVRHEETPYHVSLDFNLAGEDLPPADTAALVEDHPDLSSGLVLFDIWIANSDRHRKNIAYDKSARKVQVFDHSHALLRGRNGRQALELCADNLGIGTGHCVAEELRSVEAFGQWSERIKSIPAYYVDAVVRDCCNLGLSNADAAFCVSFLLDRRNRLPDLVDANRGSFPKIEGTLWDGWERKKE